MQKLCSQKQNVLQSGTRIHQIYTEKAKKEQEGNDWQLEVQDEFMQFCYGFDLFLFSPPSLLLLWSPLETNPSALTHLGRLPHPS